MRGMNRRGALLVLIGLLAAGPAAAGRLYGTVSVRGQNAPAAGARVEVNCSGPSEDSDRATTNEQGQYSITPSGSRSTCRVVVSYNGRTSHGVAVTVASGDTRANLELSPRNGGWGLVKQ